MRYLLNHPSVQILKKATATAWAPTTGNVIGATKTIKVPHTASTISTTKKWGQQCGVTCGCVVRFEIELDQNDRVISAEYTAKKIITTTIPIPMIPPTTTTLKENNDSTSTDSTGKQHVQHQHMRPVFTNRTKRLQYVSCQCSTLHTLCLQSIQYFINRPIYQLLNVHEFPSARSSSAFRDTILSSIPIHHPKQEMNLSHSKQPPSSSRSVRRRNNLRHYHCFDLVEDAITALLKGYIPPPRPHQTSDEILRIYRQYDYQYTLESAGMHDSPFDHDHDHDDEDKDEDDPQLYWSQSIENFIAHHNGSKTPDAASSTISWQERMLHPWWPFTSWTNTSDTNNNNLHDDDDDDNDDHNDSGDDGIKKSDSKKYTLDDSKRVQQRLSVLSYDDSDRRHWTALDWMDWLEHERNEISQHPHGTTTSADRSSSSESRISDWLTYVDTLYNDRPDFIHRATGTSIDQQSA